MKFSIKNILGKKSIGERISFQSGLMILLPILIISGMIFIQKMRVQKQVNAQLE